MNTFRKSLLILLVVFVSFAVTATVCLAFSRQWNYFSETSAVIYWQLDDISHQATGYVEYGVTDGLGKRTVEWKEPRWAQFHQISGLATDTQYYYRMVSVDPATKKETKSEILTFTTKKSEQAIRIPQNLSGPPYVLDSPGALYILTKDIVADGTVFEISADDVTLDLDGHTVVFGNDTAERVYGVRFAYGENCRLVNGTIVQGGRSSVYSAAIASLDRPQATEVCGIKTDVHLKCAYPMNFTHTTKANIHHNHIYSRVTELECRHYPGNVLMRFYTYGGELDIHDNILSEGCHWGIMLRMISRTVRNIEVSYNDIRHHQQYVNGYAIAPCTGADIHHNKITSTGRACHVTGDGTLFHDNYIDTRGHQHLSDLPARTRPFHHRLIELHGVKLEGRNTKNCKVYNNYVKITQIMPDDSGGVGSPWDKMQNGVYIRSKATSIEGGRLIDDAANWEVDRWKSYWVKYSPDRPPVKIESNSETSLTADFPDGVIPGEFTIYMKWEYVPPTPLNIACYDPNGMNEVYNNKFVGITQYKKTRHGGYGDTGQWATGIMFIAMKYGPADPGKYSVYIHDNEFESNDLFLNGSPEVNMNVRIENNTFTLLKSPHTVERESRFRGVGESLIGKTMDGNNTIQ